MNKKERFNRAYNFLKFEGVIKKQEDVAKAMNASQSNVSGALNGRESVLTDNFLMRFTNAFKQISLPWLLNEEGDMLTVTPEFKAENTPQILEGEEDKDVIVEQARMTERIMELIRESTHIPKTFALKADIEVSLFLKKLKGEKAWSVADVHKICDTYRVRKGWLVDGEGKKFRLSEEVLETIPARRSFDVRAGVPYYNVDFAMGFDPSINDQTITPEYMIDFTPYNKCDAWCNAMGQSMHPTISHGDKIAIKEVRDPASCLISGEIYAIVTTNELRTIKRVRDNGDTITLIPDNKEYPEQTISKDLILKVYKVMGSVKMF
jgi:SOS-response transcriptional repressor LexA